MYIEEYKKYQIKIKEEFELELLKVEKCKGFLEHIWFFGSYSIHLYPYSYEECIKLLHKISGILGEKYKLEEYYYDGTETNLIIRYKFDELRINFLCNEPEIAIEKLGKGKCRTIEEITTHKSIVCDL